MISLICGISFYFEAIFILIASVITLIPIINGSISPLIIIAYAFFFLIFGILALFFTKRAKKYYNQEKLINIILNIDNKENVEQIINGRDIGEIKSGKIYYVNEDNK